MNGIKNTLDEKSVIWLRIKNIKDSLDKKSIIWLWTKDIKDYNILYNTSKILITRNLVGYSRTKQIDIKYHFIREQVMNGTVELHFVPSKK